MSLVNMKSLQRSNVLLVQTSEMQPIFVTCSLCNDPLPAKGAALSLYLN